MGLKFLFQIGGNGNIEIVENFRIKHQLEEVIEVLPTLSHAQVAKYMQNANCFVLFSNFENQPCVLAEALASGLPFISSNVGGVKEFMPDQGAWVINQDDSRQLANQMATIMSEYSNIDKKVLANYARQTFSNETISLKINKIYNDC